MKENILKLNLREFSKNIFLIGKFKFQTHIKKGAKREEK